MRTFSLRSAQVDIDSLDLEETLTTFEKVPRVEDLFNEADGLNLRYCLAEIRFEQSLNLDEWDKFWSEDEGVYYYMNRRTLLSVWDRPAGFQDTEPPPPSPPVRRHYTENIVKKDHKLANLKRLHKEGEEADALKTNQLTPAVKLNLHNLIKIIAIMSSKVSTSLTSRLDTKLNQLNFDFDCLKFLESIKDHKTATRITQSLREQHEVQKKMENFRATVAEKSKDKFFDCIKKWWRAQKWRILVFVVLTIGIEIYNKFAIDANS